jgi:hypothetical protein
MPIQVVFLSSRCAEATTLDQLKLDRVLKYLNSWPSLQMLLAYDAESGVYVYVDTSFAVHRDMKGHTGSVITLGKDAVTVSCNQLPQIIWTGDSLVGEGHDVGPARTIALASTGRSTSARARHTALRFFFVKDRADYKGIECSMDKVEPQDT